jgi:hypothetical protein
VPAIRRLSDVLAEHPPVRLGDKQAVVGALDEQRVERLTSPGRRARDEQRERSVVGSVDVVGDVGLVVARLAGARRLVDVEVADPVVASALVVGVLDLGAGVLLVEGHDVAVPHGPQAACADAPVGVRLSG